VLQDSVEAGFVFSFFLCFLCCSGSYSSSHDMQPPIFSNLFVDSLSPMVFLRAWEGVVFAGIQTRDGMGKVVLCGRVAQACDKV